MSVWTIAYKPDIKATIVSIYKNKRHTVIVKHFVYNHLINDLLKANTPVIPCIIMTYISWFLHTNFNVSPMSIL